MLRRSFIQAVTAGLSALSGFATNRITALRPNPNGWTIKWHDMPDSPTSAGYWLALPTTADRDQAFRSLVPRVCVAKSGKAVFAASDTFAPMTTMVLHSTSQAATARADGRKRVEAMIRASKNASVPLALNSQNPIPGYVRTE